ncbi:GNAT family N-acetyltransferase [Actinoallomurus sp. NPDC052274]|uniref:GNAT family N-acetyltransferase n=1 Tax=Actinoallomurus sp. NPDC052274 TaxID=3155420 RepID=UPI00343D0427
MAVLSLGYQSDLMLLRLQGSLIDRRDGYLVVRTPANPTYHWGNFVLLPGPATPGTVQSWVDTFHREFPDANHVALGVDGVRGDAGNMRELAAAGLDVERSTVMTAGALQLPPRPNREADFRILASDADWRAALALKEAVNTEPDVEGYRVFARRKLAAMRRLQELGHGAWFGAFKDGRMVSGLGVFTDGSGIARYQSVDTHPDHRNQGLAGTLVYTAGRHAVAHMAVRMLIMVADPTYVAIRVYRSVGFTDTETQVQLQPKPLHR